MYGLIIYVPIHDQWVANNSATRKCDWTNRFICGITCSQCHMVSDFKAQFLCGRKHMGVFIFIWLQPKLTCLWKGKHYFAKNMLRRRSWRVVYISSPSLYLKHVIWAVSQTIDPQPFYFLAKFCFRRSESFACLSHFPHILSI